MRSVDKRFEAKVKLTDKLVCPGGAITVHEREPCLVVLSAHWRSVPEDMTTRAEACSI